MSAFHPDQLTRLDGTTPVAVGQAPITPDVSLLNWSRTLTEAQTYRDDRRQKALARGLTPEQADKLADVQTRAWLSAAEYTDLLP